MKTKHQTIGTIPAILWGPSSDHLLIAVHGNQSSKSDAVIEIAADVAVEKGYQVLSFDLPGHGDRKSEARLCDTRNCVEDLSAVMHTARTRWESIRVFGCSVGAYYSMLAYGDAPIRQALLLSPIVDMKRLIEDMMKWFGVSKEQLEQAGEAATPVSTLYWHDYQYVLQHPLRWNKPTALLYGGKDALSEYETIRAFAGRCGAALTVLEDSEHFFHTKQQLDFYAKWLRDHLDEVIVD